MMDGRKKTFGYLGFVIVMALVVFSIFYRLPYEVMKPGSAHNLDPVIDVEGEHEYKHGQFLFMTVRLVQPNIYQYALAKVLKYHELIPMDRLLQKGESQQEYETYQLHLMDTSQFAATYIAYKHAGKRPEIHHKGLIVIRVIDGMPAAKKLKPGDLIVAAEGKEIHTYKDLSSVMKGKTKGDKVSLTVKRNGNKKTLTVAIGKFPDRIINQDPDGTKYGIGIMQVPNLELKVKPNIHFHTENIGGPSGGLMFTLGIFNRLTEKNWTKGYKIAGTGTMNMKGEVGPIGGIKEKVVAADEQNVEIFFAPAKDNNYRNAAETAKDIGTDMKIVKVDTFEDALDYLKKLQPKAGSEQEKSKAS
ncbi:MAG TPA: SepM family pheromone-processing serine protease [Bacillales bacterium]|nr:SepM family pheromone-processing serine protease [Bacillales bacterium]